MNDERPPESESGGRGVAALIVPFYASADRSQRQLLGVLQLGAAAFALWILSLYFTWDDQTGALVGDPVNLWFNCIMLGGLAMTLFCVWRPRHRTAGAVAFVGLTIGMFYVLAENAFGMFTYNDARPAAGFWLGLASYVVQLAAAGYAGFLVSDECCRGRRPDGRPRSPWLVLGLGILSIGWIVARFLPDFAISVERRPIGESGNTLSEPLAPEIFHRGLVARLDGAEFIPELTAWVIFALVAPLTAWVLRRQLAAALLSGFLIYFVADIAAALAVNYGLDYSEDLENGLRITVDYGLGSGFLALLATTALFTIVIAGIYLTGSEHPAANAASPSAES